MYQNLREIVSHDAFDSAPKVDSLSLTVRYDSELILSLFAFCSNV
jgi:hypothetical protein